MLRQNSSRGVIGLNLSAAVGKRAWLVIVSFTVWAAIVTTAEYVGLLPGRISPVPFTFIGLPLGFFLAFRGNQGHARYWEARQAWNTIGNSARNFGRQVAVYNNPTGDANPEALSELSRTVIRRVVAYSCALHASLTDADVEEAANKHLDVPLADLKVEGTNVAFAILHSISAELERGMKAGLLDRLFVRIMENSLAVLSDAAGTCEKIRATPLPVPLVLITNRMLILYIAGLPIGIVDVTAWLTPVVVGIIAFAFIGLSSIAGELASPFAPGPNQLPLLTTARQLERDLLRLIGDPIPELPAVSEDGCVP